MFKRLRQISQRVTNDLAAELLKRSPFKRSKLSESAREPEVRASLRKKADLGPETRVETRPNPQFRDRWVRKVRVGQTKKTSDEKEKRIASVRVSTGQGVKTLSAKKGSAKSSSAKKTSKAMPVKAGSAKSGVGKSAAVKAGPAKSAGKKSTPSKSAPSVKAGVKSGVKAGSNSGAKPAPPSKEKSTPKLAAKPVATSGQKPIQKPIPKPIVSKVVEAQAAVKSPAVVSAPVRGKATPTGGGKTAAVRVEIPPAQAQVESMPASAEAEAPPVKLRQDPDPDRVAEKKKKKDDFKIDRNGDLVAQWEALREKTKLIKPLNYKMSESFEARIPIMHKVLGWGFVISNQNDRLEVLFKDGIRNLISNYKG